MIWSTSATRQQELSAEATMPTRGNLDYFDEKRNPALGD